MRRLGESALALVLPAPATLQAQRRIWSVARAARAWSGVGEVVPAMNNVTLFFDPDAADAAALERRLREAWQSLPESTLEGRSFRIEVAYGGDAGPDLEAVAKRARLSVDEAIACHCAPEYVVYFIGFVPGFAYLGGLDRRLHAPRRAQPRTAVPAGSVGIGGEQTGIYPLRSPGGWQLIGRTDCVLFDPRRDPAALLSPGDRVRFVPIRS